MGKVKVLPGGHLELVDGIRWPCATSSVLYKRFFFDDLFDKVLGGFQTSYDAGSNQGLSFRWVISGQPGIGKSVFGWYIIYRVLTDQPSRTIVYISETAKASYIIRNGSDVETIASLNPSIDALDLPLVVSDSHVCPIYETDTVIISSPGRLNNREHKNILNLFQAFYIFQCLLLTK